MNGETSALLELARRQLQAARNSALAAASCAEAALALMEAAVPSSAGEKTPKEIRRFMQRAVVRDSEATADHNERGE